MKNSIYYGDNLDVLRRYIKDETVDLCYIDPPFNSKRNYNQIYNNVGKEDAAQAQAFVDTWTWDNNANLGLAEIQSNYNGVFTEQSIDLITGLEKVLKKGALLAYLVSMTLRIAEIHRVLKPTGSFYFHCDPNASHYLKLVIDAIFCAKGGDYLNEIIWKRAETVKGNFGQGSKRLDTNTDTIFFYSKCTDKNVFSQPFKDYSDDYVSKFYKYTEPDGRRYQLISMTGPGGAAKGNPQYEIMGVTRYWRYSKETMQDLINNGLVVQTKSGNVPRKKLYLDDGKGVAIQSLWDDIPALHAKDSERLGYPTQKPEALLERIIKASSNEGDVILDAYCGCGTTVAVAQKLKRQWIGIDITYQSISLILKRLEDQDTGTLDNIIVAGVPKDMDSAIALANRKDDRTRKEFEKWLVLTYSKNRAIINEKKGGDGGIDGIAYIPESKSENSKILFSVKSNQKLTPAIIRDLFGTVEREKAVCGILLTLYPMPNLIKESKKYGLYYNHLTGREYDKIQVVCVQEILDGKCMDLPNPREVLKKAEQHAEQLRLLGN